MINKILAHTCIVSLITILPFSYKIFTFTPNGITTKIIICIVCYVMLFALIFLSLQDIEAQEVLFSVVVIMIGLLSFVFLYLVILDGNFNLWEGFSINYKDSLLGALILAIPFSIIVISSKEKALGQADIFLAFIAGFIVGINNIVIWFYVTIISATIYSIAKVIKFKKMKDLTIPLVPFIVLGIFITSLFAADIKDIVKVFVNI